jgi:hypothetical protein
MKLSQGRGRLACVGDRLSVRSSVRLFFGTVVALFGLGASACSLGGGGADSTASATPTAGATEVPASSSATGTPTVVAGDVVFLDARPLAITPGRAELPSELALVVQRNGELWRIHRAPDGTVEERLLFDPFAYSGTRLITYWNIGHLGPALPPGQLVIAACTEGECPGQGTFSEDAVVSFFRSGDGGASWTVSEPLDGAALIATASELDSFVLQRRAREGDSRTGRFESWPDGQVIDPPTAATADRGAFLLDRLLVWWTTDGRLIDADGNARLALGDGLRGGSVGRGIAVLANADASRLAVTWDETSPDETSGVRRWSIYDLEPNGRYRAAEILDAPFPMIPVAWLADGSLLLSGDFDWADLGEVAPTSGASSPRLPVILDVSAGTLTAVDIPGGTLGSGWAVAMQQGPFVEIDAGEGDCLNLRTEPSLDGGALRCIAHATLLERLSPLDGEWVNVRTSDGVTGWVSGEFVRGGRGRAGATATPEATGTAEASGTPTAEE